ncbi:CAP domain-containing protein [Sediminibacillus albus]|uniref:Uncharacterized protein, YkwD family n=1 Tax=Sediminibacillus albus TaxID=407036 RepID=A0A1G8ZQR4_9BACI|nr:CAP domain-containing protein [Sediminibacillus albus]SDK17439.1 uncharacterized protein, YkwD family [Sediminibacillus albus]
MFKKVSMATALSAALLFGGVFSSSVDAQENNGQSTTQQVYYSINSSGFDFSEADVQSFVNKYFSNQQFNWKQKEPVQQEEQPAPAGEENKLETTGKQPADQQQTKEPSAEQPPAPQENTNYATADESKQEQSQKQAEELSEFEQQVVELTNDERSKQGLAPLQIDTELSKVAREKSADMARNGYFSHNSPTYGSPFDMMKQFGISYNTAGENIAKGQRTPEEVVNAWMNSEGHRENILNGNFTHIGVGYVKDGNVWTQQFIGK